MSSAPQSPQLNFDKARFGDEAPPADACTFCQRSIHSEYFRVGGHMACDVCARNASELVPPDTHKAYSRALLYGAGAAAAGCLGYALFGILTGITLGWAAIGVGWLVGKAMRKGSGGLGGKRYQVTAALLTYAAVAVAFVPMALHDANRQGNGDANQAHSIQQSEGQQAAHAEQRASHDTGKPADTKSSFLLAVLMLLGLGLVSPFLIFTASVGSGLFNLFVLFLGIRTAWQLSASGRAIVEGPYAP